MSYLASGIIADLRMVTDHDSDTQFTDAQIVPLLDSEYQRLRRHIGDLVPDLYTKVSADFTLGATPSQDLSANPPNVQDLLKIRSIEIKSGSFYRMVPLAPFTTSGSAGYLCWRQRGFTTVDFFPVELVSAQTFRAKYIAKPARITATSDALDVPDGADAILRERVASLVRGRFEESDPHAAQAGLMWKELSDSLITMYPSTPVTVEDISARY